MNGKEQWISIAGHPNYMVSNEGNFMNVNKNTILEPMKDKYREYVNIGQGNDKKKSVHYLVATYFIDNPENYTKIEHIDKDRFNNKADNLKWVKREDTKHVFKRKMDKPILQYDMNMKLIREWSSIKELIDSTNYYTGHIYKCLNGINTKAYEYIWKYKYFNRKEIVMSEDEVYKNIGIFEGIDFSNYKMSNYGKVKNINRTNLLKIYEYDNYHSVLIYDINNKGYTLPVPRLVLHLFKEPPNQSNKFTINFKDSDVSNNYYKNLEWVTLEEKYDKIRQGLIEEGKKENPLEIWRTIKNYSGYIISDLGRIISLALKRVLVPNNNGSYYRINLCSDDGHTKRLRVHILVAKTFVPNDDIVNNIIVDHIDNDKLNNKAENLQWTTYKGNSENYHQNHKKPFYKPILQYDKDMNFIKEWNSVYEVKELLNYDVSNIQSCMNGKYQYAYGFIWKYKLPKIINIKTDEIFKNIGTFENKDFSNYEISNYGNVKSLKRNMYFTINIREGYCIVTLYDKTDNKTYQINVHRLVAHCFVNGRTTERKYVNHIDENKQNNYYKNLEWVTIKENNDHSLGIKVHQICMLTGQIINTFNSIVDAKKYLNLKTDISIRKCLNNEYTHGYGYKWIYADKKDIIKKAIKQNEIMKKQDEAIIEEIDAICEEYQSIMQEILNIS